LVGGWPAKKKKGSNCAVLERMLDGGPDPCYPVGIHKPWASIWVVAFGTRNECIARAQGVGAVRAVGAVDAYAALSFADHPRHGRWM
jgi:cell division protein FtsX